MGNLWSSEKTDTLRSLYADGKSYGAIAEILGVPRNAVAGKVSRLKLDKRNYTPSVQQLMSKEGMRRTAVNTGRIRKLRDAPPQMSSSPLPTLVMAEAKPPLNIDIITNTGCKWPGSEHGKFCGHDRHDFRYCEPHVRASGRAE
jgi:hypothetical protein